MWKINNPIFQHVQNDAQSKFDETKPWSGHRDFVYDLVCNMQPKTIVELGTFQGNSFFAFCQAVKDMNLRTEVFSIDSFEGDEQAGKIDDHDYREVLDLTRKYFGEINARLIKSKFDNALEMFKDNSIDIIHIDGFHEYESVKRDYDLWKKKLSSRGVLIFHDIKVADFGVWKVWNECKEENKGDYFIEFLHGFGLGVMIKDSTLKEKLIKLANEEVFLNYYKLRFNLLQLSKLNNKSRLSKSVEFTELSKKEVLLNELIDEYRTKIYSLTSSDNLNVFWNNLNNNSIIVTQLQQNLDAIRSRKIFKLYNMLLKLFGKNEI